MAKEKRLVAHKGNLARVLRVVLDPDTSEELVKEWLVALLRVKWNIRGEEMIANAVITLMRNRGEEDADIAFLGLETVKGLKKQRVLLLNGPTPESATRLVWSGAASRMRH